MSVAAEEAIRAWINALTIVDPDAVIPRGAYLKMQRSPAWGAYIVLARTGAPAGPFAEPGPVDVAHVDCAVYAGTQDAAENAAASLRSEFEKLTGCPQPCAGTGATILCASNYSGPVNIPVPADAGEQYCFQVGADFMISN